MLLFARLRNLVWNGDTERLRLPWRLLVWLVLLVGLGFLAQLLIVLVRSPSAEPLLVLVTPGLSPDRALIAVLNVVFLLLQLVVMVGSVYVAGRYLDRRQFPAGEQPEGTAEGHGERGVTPWNKAADGYDAVANGPRAPSNAIPGGSGAG